MNISKFKLRSGVLDGVIIEGIEKMPHENMMYLDDVSRTRKVPLSDELRDKIQNLKYFYLNLTSHWIAPFNKYFDVKEYKLLPIVYVNDQIPQGQTLLHDIWNHAKITGVTIKNGGFVLTGEIEVVEGKKLGIATPFITEEDDLSFYMDAIKKIEEIMEDLSNAIETRALPMPKDKAQMMISFGEKPEDVESLSMDEIEQKLMNRLIEKGAIIMMDESSFQHKEISDGSSKAILNTNTKSIDSNNMPEAEIHTDDNEDVDSEDVPAEEVVEQEKPKKQVAKKKNADSSLVSDAKFNIDMNGEIPKAVPGKAKEDIPEGGSLDEMEYSANLGMSDQQQEENMENKGEW
jgi:hypothetical protein